MNTLNHSPNPDFRARLEVDVVRAFQREAQFASASPWLAPRRLRGVSLLIAGLILGFSTEFASGQVQESRERERLLEAADSYRRLTLMRLQIAEEALKNMRSQFDAGVVSRDAVVRAEADCQEMRLNVVRQDLEMAETRASSEPPRNELWAPLVGGRDFVSERLKIDAAIAQDRLRLAEVQLEEAKRGERVGVTSAAALADAEAQVEERRNRLDLIGMKLTLRRESLEQRLSPEATATRLKRVELVFEVQATLKMLRRAENRLSTARERARAGAASELDVKRAELDVLELQMRLQRLELARRSDSAPTPGRSR